MFLQVSGPWSFMGEVDLSLVLSKSLSQVLPRHTPCQDGGGTSLPGQNNINISNGRLCNLRTFHWLKRRFCQSIGRKCCTIHHTRNFEENLTNKKVFLHDRKRPPRKVLGPEAGERTWHQRLGNWEILPSPSFGCGWQIVFESQLLFCQRSRKDSQVKAISLMNGLWSIE